MWKRFDGLRTFTAKAIRVDPIDGFTQLNTVERGKNGRNNYLQLMSILLRNFERMMSLRPSGNHR